VTELPHLAAVSSRVPESNDRPATIAPQVVAHKRQVEALQLGGLPAAVGAAKGVQPTTDPSAPLRVIHVRETSQGVGLKLHKAPKASPAAALVAAAGIKEVLTTPTRSSPRLAGAIEEHVMDKVKKRAALKNLEPIEGKTSNSSFLSFSDVVVHSNLSNMGVTLGKNDSEVSDSIMCLKTLEAKCLPPKLSSKEMEEQHNIALLDSEEDDNLDNITLGHLCGDLMEEVMDEDSDHLSCDFQAVFKKNKSKSSSKKKKIAKIRMARKNKNGSP
jgi:hypothetical protein